MAPLAAVATKKPTALEWLWFLGFGWMALSGLRYGIWLSAVMVIITARLLVEWLGSRIDRPGSFRNPVMNLAIGSFMLMMSFAFLPGLRQAWWPVSIPILNNTPEKAVKWLAERPDIPGPLWGELAFSSYLTFALPDRPVWIHTRFEAFPPDHVMRYLNISSAAQGWNEMLEEEGANLLLLNLNEQKNLIAAVEKLDTWKEVYRDEIAVIFVRQSQ